MRVTETKRCRWSLWGVHLLYQVIPKKEVENQQICTLLTAIDILRKSH
jgi:hypothetical protein